MIILHKSYAAKLGNSVEPDQMPHSAASDLGLHCFPAQACLSQYLGLSQYFDCILYMK